LREIAPAASLVAVVLNPGTPYSALAYKELEAAANIAKVRLKAFEVHTPEEIAPQLQAARAISPDGVAVLEDPLTFSQRNEITTLVSRLRLPAVYGYREFAEAGGLMSYGTDHDAQWRRGAELVDLIFKGAKPAELPVEQPTRFELVVNLKAAKTLDLTVPPTILLRADRIIE
jgi:putative ABC transport system substrate-binding protein